MNNVHRLGFVLVLVSLAGGSCHRYLARARIVAAQP